MAHVQYSSKIKTRKQIRRIAGRLRKEGKKIVTANGSFDLFHLGHVKFLEAAKSNGDVLFVGVNSNTSIHKYKSRDRPIIDEKQRLGIVASLGCVGYVTLMDEAEIAGPLVRLVKPHVHLNGAEYGRNPKEADAIKKVHGKLVLFKRAKGISTTGIIDKIRRLKLKQ